MSDELEREVLETDNPDFEIRDELREELNSDSDSELREDPPMLRDGGDDDSAPDPITREEVFLAAIAGEDVTVPTPVIRKEEFLAAIDAHIGSVEEDVKEIQDVKAAYGTPAVITYTASKAIGDALTPYSAVSTAIAEDYAALKEVMTAAEAAAVIASKLHVRDSLYGYGLVYASMTSPDSISIRLQSTTVVYDGTNQTFVPVAASIAIAINLVNGGGSGNPHLLSLVDGTELTASDYTVYYYNPGGGGGGSTGRQITWTYFRG